MQKLRFSAQSILKKSLIALCAVASLIGFAACGTQEQAAPAAQGENGAIKFDPSTVKKDDSIAALVPDSIKSKGKLVIGSDLTYAPAEFIDNDGKTPVGYDVDLSKALAAVFGLQVDIESSSFDSIIPAIGTKYDLGISDFIVTQKRLASVNMVSYANGGMMYVVKKGNPTKVDLTNLCGTKIAVETGSSQEEKTNKSSDDCKAAGKSPIEVQSYSQQTQAATAVVTGKAQLFYAGTSVAGYAVKQNGNQLETIGKDEDAALTGVVIAKNDMQMTQAVQKAVQKLMDDGTYKKIFDIWGVGNTAIPVAKINDPTA